MHSTWLRHTIFLTLLIVFTSAAVICFGHLLQLVIFIHSLLPSCIILFSFLAGFASFYLYQRRRTKNIASEIKRLYTADKKGAAIPFLHIPLLVFTTLLSHLFGASVGREGVAVQIGGTFGSFFSRRKKQWNIDIPSRVIITTGMATGFAALFGMPLTAALFAVEISRLYSKMAPKWLFLPLIGSLVATQFSTRFGLVHLHFQIDIPHLTPAFFYAFIFLSFLLIIATTCYLFLHHKLSTFLKKSIPSPFLRIFIGSIVLSLLLFIFHLDHLHGLGSSLITQSVAQPNTIDWFLPFLKILFTLGFLALGFKGGEVTPIFAIGAMLGAIAATTFNLPASFFVILGLAAFFSTTTKTYFAPLLLVAEVTSPFAVPFMIPLVLILTLFTPKTGIYQTLTEPFFTNYKIPSSH